MPLGKATGKMPQYFSAPGGSGSVGPWIVWRAVYHNCSGAL
jgi:hypothetical protein